ncbi:hypothetical protein [Noviherbaspirillum autotrophicum]|uniref:hypothetical protein n=1 Tax=Noviherbaspirillum autotrophicum TaxID=709839 RepID=UPI0012FE5CA5|nr:hypothetical protein [Noviherbaspirillum autotrophicum]
MVTKLNANDLITFAANTLIFIGAALVSLGVASDHYFILPARGICYSDVFLVAGLLAHIGSSIASWWTAPSYIFNRHQP